jgi:hypothetical protein
MHQMGDKTAIFELEANGRLAEPAKLASFLKKAEGKPVQIDATNTPLITSLHLQVVMAANTKWSAQDLAFEFTNTNDQFESCLALLGWQPDAQTPEVLHED